MFSVSAVIVTYNPNFERLSNLVTCLKEQLSNVVIVDNNSKNFELISNLISENVKVIRLDDNYGIAKAQNIGIEYLKGKTPYFILFDQDSNIPSDFVEIMYNKYIELSNSFRVGVLGPALYNDEFKYYYPILNVEKIGLVTKKYIKGDCVDAIQSNLIIASGSFMSFELINDIGGMKDYFFIDSVDTEFTLRCQFYKYQSFITPSVKINHLIGDENIFFLGKKITKHSPFRRYFMIRNFIYMFKYKYVPNFFIITMIFRYLASHFIIIFNSKNWTDYFYALIKGFFDGLKGVIK